MPNVRALLRAGLCLFFACCVQAKTTSNETVEDFPDSMLDDHVAIIASSVSVLGVLMLLVTLSILTRIWKPSLPVLMSLMIWTMVVVVSIITWDATFVAFRDVVQDQMVVRLQHTGRAIDKIRVDFGVCSSMLDLFAREAASRERTPDAFGEFPDPFSFVHDIFASVGRTTTMTRGIYYGMEDGRLLGSSLRRNGSYTHVSQKAGQPSQSPVKCNPKWDYPLPGAPCYPADCGANPYNDTQYCPRTCKVAAASSNCRAANATHTSTVGVIISHTYPWRVDPETIRNISSYDPRVRPWYVDAYKYPGLMWHAPYMFSSSTSAGITLTKGLYRDGVFRGVVAIDYTLLSMGNLLKKLIPTPKAILCLIQADGALLSSSLTVTGLTAETGFANVRAINNIMDAPNPDSRFKAAALMLKARFGTLPRAVGAADGLYQMDHDSALYVSSVRVSGGYDLLALVDVPYSDLMKEGKDASTLALGIAVALSFVFGMLALLLTHVALSPLTTLGKSMDKVAWMKLSEVEPMSKSLVSEVAWMQTSFEKMVDILTEFRMYLPQSMLDDMDEEDDDTNTEFSSIPRSENVTIVFTDIYCGTHCWEESPAGMRVALRVHHAIVRETLCAHDGHEVKTIADSFMIAFNSAEKAVHFAVEVQEKLNEATWAPEILALQYASKSKDGLWAGLRLVVGIHAGRADAERGIDGRIDYYGTTVNKAARVQNCCVPGCVAVTPEVLSCCNFDGPLWKGGAPISKEIGQVQMKGLAGGAHVTLLVPATLAGRLSAVEGETRTKVLELENKAASDGRGLKVKRVSYGGATESSIQTGRSSDGSASSGPGYGRMRPEKADIFRERLQLVQHATVVSVQIRFGETLMLTEDPVVVVNDTLARVLHAAAKERGHVLAVTGGELTFGWNVRKTCAHQLEMSFRFIKKVVERVSRVNHIAFSTGLAYGSVLTGNVGGGGQKFITAFGPAMQMARLLQESALSFGVRCLVATMPGADSRALAAYDHLLRPVDTWTHGHGEQMIIWELNYDLAPGAEEAQEARDRACETADIEHNMSDNDADTKAPYGWSNSYKTAFFAKDIDAISERQRAEPSPLASVNGASTQTVAKVLDMLEAGHHLRAPLHELALL